MGCMFDNLIRRDPRDGGKAIIPDLAHSWEIAKDRKTYTFYPAQGHPVPRRRGTDIRRREGDVRPYRETAAGHQHPAQHPVPCGERGERARQVHHRVQAVRAKAAAVHHGGDRQRLERDRAQEDAGGQQLQPAQGSGRIPAPGRSRRCAGWRTRSGSSRRTRTTGTRACLISTASSSTTWCRSRPNSARAILAGRVDYGRVTDPVTFKKAQATKGMKVSSFNQSVIQRDLYQHQEAAARRPARAARDAPGARPADADRRDQGRGADADRRLHVSVLGFRDAEGRAGQAHRLPGSIRPLPSRRRRR